MSDAFAYTDRLNLQEQVVRIDRMIAETQKLLSESNKLQAEERKFDRDRLLAPILAIVGIIGGLVAVGTLILHATGH